MKDSELAKYLFPFRCGTTNPNIMYDNPPELIDYSLLDYPNFGRPELIKTGFCVLHCEIFSDGFVGEIGVIRKLDNLLDEIAINSVKTWKFKPAQKDGKDISCWVSFPVYVDFQERKLFIDINTD